MLKITNITVKHKNQYIINNISHTFQQGTCTAIIGNNGAGKTCLIQTIIGQIQANKGSIYMTDKTLGYCPDRGGLQTELTAVEQRTMTQKITHTSDNSYTQWIAPFDLTQRLHTPIKHLSQGNRQKVSIINSIVYQAQNYIRDEPTQHLDPKTRKVVHNLMDSLRKQQKTIIYTTHFLEDIGPQTDQCIILEQGHIQNTYSQPFTQESIIQHFHKKDNI